MQSLRLEGLGLERRRLLRHRDLYLLDLRVVLLQVKLQVGRGLRGLDCFPAGIREEIESRLLHMGGNYLPF